MCRDDCHCDYRIPKGQLLFQVAGGCILTIYGTGLIVSDFGRLSPADWLPPLVLIAIGLFLPGETAFRIRRQKRNQSRVVLSEMSLAVPGLFPIGRDSRVPYDQITGVTEIGGPGFFRMHMIHVSHNGGKTRIACKCLPETGAAAEIMRLLRERLEPYPVAFKYQETFGIRWSNIQFSLRSILLATTVLAVVLGLWMYVDPVPQWSDLGSPIFFLTGYVLPFLLAFTAYRPVRIFGIGYFIGVAVEFLALMSTLISLRNLTTGVFQQGSYPLSLPIMRMFVAFGWEKPDWFIVSARPFAIAVFISGMLTGTGVLLIWGTASWLAAWRRGAG